MKKKKTILVVEDEKELRRAIVDVLTHRRFLVLEAENGKEGVEIALKSHPDLILLDLLMPVMDGMTALEKIRADAWGADVPVMILTNLSTTHEQLAKDMVTYLPMYYLVKSNWKIHDVVGRVEEIIQASKLI